MRSVMELGSSVPAFLGKLWKLVNDSETNHLISWTPSGKTFVIKDQAVFARELLPLYYKHNNMASFIRQLNMYGFHKITSVENGGLRCESDEIEFTHACFMKGQAYLLEHIKRKNANTKSIIASNENGEKIILKPELMNNLLLDVKQMKGKQEGLDAKFSAMKQENEALWREVAILRQKHIKQQQIVNNLIQFLMSLVQPNRTATTNTNGVGVKRPYQLMINSEAHNSATSSGRSKHPKLHKETDLLEELCEENLEDGPTIHELVHDDLLHTETSQDAPYPEEYLTVEVTSSPVVTPAQSPNTDTTGQIQYHVTLDDRDELQSNIVGKTIYTIPTTVMDNITTSTATLTDQTQVDTSIKGKLINNSAITVTAGTSTLKDKASSNRSVRSTGKNLSPINFHVIPTSTDLRVPSEIFASDDSISNTGLPSTDDVALQNVLQDPLLSLNVAPTTTPKDKMVGGLNIKLDEPRKVAKSTHSKKSKKSKKEKVTNVNLQNIKTELEDDLDWSNMTLATVDNNTNVNRFQTMNKRDYFSKNLEDLTSHYGKNNDDIDDHIDTMQTDLDSLRELFRSDSYSLDANTFMGLFGPDDPFYGLSYNLIDDRSKPNGAKKQKEEPSNLARSDGSPLCPDEIYSDEANQLISYTGNMPDLMEFSLPELEGEGETSRDARMSPVLDVPSTLNTPQDILNSPGLNQNHIF